MKKICKRLLIVIAFGFAACTAPPTEEMNRAHDAVIRAENDADAVTYAGNTLIRARDALVRMQDEADAKRYEEAKKYAAEAISNAEKAIADGKSGAERAREEATAVLNSLQGLIAETLSAINSARDVPNLQTDFDSITRNMDLARMNNDEAWSSFRADNFSDAIAKGHTVRSTLAEINSRLNVAAQDTIRKQ
jgi:hypothetical protein